MSDGEKKRFEGKPKWREEKIGAAVTKVSSRQQLHINSNTLRPKKERRHLKVNEENKENVGKMTKFRKGLNCAI